MRVITGAARGKRLITLEGRDVRPTPERVKEGLFSAIQFDIEGRRILDLFAGSGQLGIEALSRGAEKCTFVDASADSVETVKENLELTGLSDKAKVIRSDFMPFTVTTPDTFDIAFLDPPYKAGFLEPALIKVAALMSDYGIIICEHPDDIALPLNVDGFVQFKNYKYGKIVITIYKKEVSDA